MARRLRLWESGVVYSGVSRTVDRQFLFKPNQQPDNRLLRWDSDPRSLDLDNKPIPRPSIINVVGSSLVRAQKHNPVDLFWAEANINHIHPGLAPSDDQSLDNTSKFIQHANSLIARGVNSSLTRDGHLFGAPLRAEPCISDMSAEEKFFYAVTNVVKDGLVEKVSHSPFFSTYRHFAFGEPLEYWWIEWRKFELAGGFRNNKIHPKDFLEWGKLELSCLPAWEDLTIHQRQTRFRRRVRDIEEECRESRKDEGRPVFGVPALFSVDPRDRPKKPKLSSRQPLCHASSRAERKAFAIKWREFLQEHLKASWDYRNGYWEREFPQGSFRPPITTIYNSSHL